MFNPYIVVPFVVWAITQFLKFSLAAFRGDINFKYLYGSGGMPSVHSAVVTSLATTALLVGGVNSPIFGLSLIFAAIVMYDSFGVRRSAGEQAAAINQIIDSMGRDRLGHPDLHLREILGHKPLEVTVGAILGLIFGGLFNSSHLGPLIHDATLAVGHGMAIIDATFAGLLLLGGLVVRFALWHRHRKLNAVARLKRSIWWTLLILAIIGGVLAAAEYEKVNGTTWLVWPIVYLIAVIVAIITLTWRNRGVVKLNVEATKAAELRQRWFEGPNKKRRAKAARSARRR